MTHPLTGALWADTVSLAQLRESFEEQCEALRQELAGIRLELVADRRESTRHCLVKEVIAERSSWRVASDRQDRDA